MNIDDKSIFDVAFKHPFVSFIDFLNGNKFNICQNMMLSAEIQHFLRFFNTANQRTANCPPSMN